MMSNAYRTSSTTVPGVSANDPMFAFLDTHQSNNNKSAISGGVGLGVGGTGHTSPSPQTTSYSVSKGLDQNAASDFRDTVLFLVHQQSQRHNDLLNLVKGLAGDVGKLRKEVATSGNSPLAAASGDNQKLGSGVGSRTAGAAVATDGVVGFEGSYASTQKPWVSHHAPAMSYVREEELEASRKRIDALERQVDSLKAQVKAKDDTIRRLTDASVATLMSAQSTIALGANAAVRTQGLSRSMVPKGVSGAASASPTRSIGSASVTSPSRILQQYSSELGATSPSVQQPIRSSLKSSSLLPPRHGSN